MNKYIVMVLGLLMACPIFAKEKVASDPLQQKVESLLVKGCRYLLNTDIPGSPFAGNGEISSFGGIKEVDIRKPAAIAYALSVMEAYDLNDPKITLHNDRYIRNQIHRIVVGLAEIHKSNSEGGWGDVWQSPLWATYMGAAFYFSQDLFDNHEKELIRKAILSECEYVCSLKSPGTLYWYSVDGTLLNKGDSKSEEVAWNNSILVLASALYPDAPDMELYKETMIRLGVIANSTRSDITSGGSVSGYEFSNLEGWNINEDGTVINHGRVHPDYIVSSGPTLHLSTSVAFHNGTVVPEAVFHNVDKLCKALCEVEFSPKEYAAPGGTIYRKTSSVLYYPQGNDWGKQRCEEKAAWDILAYRFGFCPEYDFSRYAHLHLDWLMMMQDRFTTGQVFMDDGSENHYYGREALFVQCMALSYVALKLDRTYIR